MTDTPPKPDSLRAGFTYNGNVSDALAHFESENQKVENALSNLSQHEKSFIEARKEVLGKIVKTRRRQSWRLRRGSLWLRWLGMQRIMVELRIFLTNILSLFLFFIGWLIMVAITLATIAFGIYLFVQIIEALVNG